MRWPRGIDAEGGGAMVRWRDGKGNATTSLAIDYVQGG